MNDISKLPEFPDRSLRNRDKYLEDYYRDLAAAWESRARLLYAYADYASVDDTDAASAIQECGPLPKKEL